jgi:exosortase D (VPLPA-CTERM-specific)
VKRLLTTFARNSVPSAIRGPASDVPWRVPYAAWGLLLVALALIFVLALDSLQYMVSLWSSKEEYGYAYLLPAISAFMAWQRRDQLAALPFRGSWIGVALLFGGLLLAFLGELSTLYIVVQYAVLLMIAALVLAFTGWPGFRQLAMPLLLLAFIIPLPNFLYQSISAQSQLLSSQLGVALIKVFGISVFLDGNIIDLGSYKLLVAEACNGLRYLFPLMALGFIAAYFFNAAWWKRAIVFVSTIPITILMNSFRIGMIGILVEHGGRSMAEGFLHDFEGWVIFMLCTGVLVGEMWLLVRVGRNRRTLRESFAIDLPPRRPGGMAARVRPMPAPFYAALALVAVAFTLFASLPDRHDDVQRRDDFAGFPMTVEQWQGRQDALDALTLHALKLNDYLLADYVGADKRPLNMYVAYYASQRKGESVHSPRSCIPGGGWEITSLSESSVPATAAGKQLRVNRVVIERAGERQLVYYWFQQRGRIVTNEYLVKWFLFWDALTRNRTDGALVRLMTNVGPGGDIAEAERRLAAFASAIGPRLSSYVPD